MQVAIIGAGVAGLTLASRLTNHGVKVVIIEREDRVGGLAKSFIYQDGSTFDVGPHRFHTDDIKVQKFIEQTLGQELLTIDRDSQLFILGKYLPWPITLKNIFSLPPGLLINATRDMLFPVKAQNDSFQDYIIERYGKTLFEVFFKPYTEKFLNVTCKNLHRDWASAGINRATIDKQVKIDSLVSLIKSLLMSKSPATKFLYPKTGGIGAFTERLYRDLISKDARILLSSHVVKINSDNKNITSVMTESGEVIPVDFVFWSGSLNDLMKIGTGTEEFPKMRYLSTVLFNYIISCPTDKNFQWCYYGDADMEVDRICLPRNFNPGNVPQGKGAICVEVVVPNDNSDIWREPEQLDCVLETFLLNAGLVKSLDHIDTCHVERIPQTYPVYSINYPRKLKKTFQWVDDTWENLTLIGRTGRFWYNNMDHSIAASLEVADRFITDFQQGVIKKGNCYSVEDRYFGGK